VDGYFNGNGSGVYNNGNIAIANCTFSGNNGVYGGAIYSSGLLTVESSTFFANHALSGGGISNWGTLVITNSTFSANVGEDWAGGIDNWGAMTLLNSTIAENSVVNGAGAGIYTNQLGNTTLINTIVANNQGGDCFGSIIDNGHNLDSDGTCNLDTVNGSLPNMDPLLGPLQNNGGSTSTQALLANSPAIDSGDNTHCPASDQRAYPRPMDGNGDAIPSCDIGAYEDSLGILLVNTLVDDVKADGFCSLHEALQAANTNSLVYDCGQGDSLTDTIIFSVHGTITLTSQLTVLPEGSVIVDGKDKVTLSGETAGRVWWVEPDGQLTLRGLSIEDALLGDEYGGGLYNNSGSVVITNSTFLHNTAEWGGGAIYNLGTISVVNSDFSGSIASGSFGGAITSYGTMTLTNSTISDSLAYICGGFDNEGVAFIDRSTISGNTAYWGGAGLCNYGELTILNSTVSGNNISEGYGGGIYNTGTMTMTNGTVTANSAPSGGGIHGGSGISLINTIVANNTGGDCDAPVIDTSHNLDSDGSCGLNPAHGSLPNTDPMLGPLQNNGGPTFTHALLTGSPAIDAGDNALCPSVDQRGVQRPLDGNEDGVADCDIGAYEYSIANTYFIPIVYRNR
jgi:CSLREA domain-containing protein